METESTVVDEKGEEIVEVQPRRRNGPPAPPTTANVTPAGSGWDGRATNGGGEGGANFNPDVPPGYTGGGPVQPPSGGHARGHGRQPPPPPCTKRTKWDDASVKLIDIIFMRGKRVGRAETFDFKKRQGADLVAIASSRRVLGDAQQSMLRCRRESAKRKEGRRM